MNINTYDVLEAAGTKWNFLPFKPGLVGGHCIGVDPYYIAQKAQEFGYNPEIILAGRRINDGMGEYIATNLIKLMKNKSISIPKSKVLVLGITFKENCPDIRNTKVIDVIKNLNDHGIDIKIYDPWANKEEVFLEYGLSLVNEIPKIKYDAIVLTVAHEKFKDIKLDDFMNTDSVLYDIKNFLPKSSNRYSL
tara:strand:- start:3 stop:578 length:576 start_codon:yes stop_codon:yes gene_type:complete